MWLSGHKQVQYFTDSQVARWCSRRPINGKGRGESPPRQDLPIAIEIGSPQVHVVRNISPQVHVVRNISSGLRGPNISCKSSCCPQYLAMVDTRHHHHLLHEKSKIQNDDKSSSVSRTTPWFSLTKGNFK